jgi:hypothetical protein
MLHLRSALRGFYEAYSLLGCDAVQPDRNLLIIEREKIVFGSGP